MNDSMIASQICNAIKAETEQVAQTGFPLSVLPQAVQNIVLDWAIIDNYVIEFLSSAMLSAVSAALGNARVISIRGDWQSNAAIYMIFVGIPGFGKSPAMQAAYHPIEEYDERLMQQFNAEMDAYEATRSASKGESGNEKDKPVLKCIIANDFTPEALLEIHSRNLRGVVIKVDEIIGMYRGAMRYNGASQQNEQLLTAWSNNPICVQRKGLSRPIRIDHPCINTIGTMQPSIVPELFKLFNGNGMMDRILFVYPYNKELKHWTELDTSIPKRSPRDKWKVIVNKVLDIEGHADDRPLSTISFNKEATKCFHDWWNSIIDYANEHRNDGTLDSRWAKRNVMVARLALILQVLKWACGEGSLENIDVDAVKGAIALSNYYEMCYQRLLADMTEMNTDEEEFDMVADMGSTFTTQKAKTWGKEHGISDRTVMYRIKELIKKHAIKRVGRGCYAVIGTNSTSENDMKSLKTSSPKCNE